jgi:hypothetical protein
MSIDWVVGQFGDPIIETIVTPAKAGIHIEEWYKPGFRLSPE